MDTVTLTLAPGQNGTKQLVQHYGTQLICVRYRKTQNGTSYKTVELRVPQNYFIAALKPHPKQLVRVRLMLQDAEMERELADRGAHWVATEKLWWVEWSSVEALQLKNHVVYPEQMGLA